MKIKCEDNPIRQKNILKEVVRHNIEWSLVVYFYGYSCYIMHAKEKLQLFKY